MATVIAWNEDYSVGIAEVDQHHRVLIEIINKLYTALVSKASHATIEEILEELVQYTRMHFAAEECLMRLFAYPKYEEHKAIHDRIVKRVLLFQAKFREGGTRIGMDLYYFLSDWLTKHINEEDKAYSPHIARNNKPAWLRPFR